MKKHIFLLLKVLFLSIYIVTGVFPIYTQERIKKNPYFLQIENTDLSFKSGSEIELKIVLTNVTNEEIYFVRCIDRDDFEIVVKDGKEKSVSLNEKALLRNEEPKTSSCYAVRLEPNKKFYFAIELNDFYNLKKGKFSLSINRFLFKKDKKTTLKAEMKPTEIAIY